MIVGVNVLHMALAKPTGVRVVEDGGQWSLQFYLHERPLYALAFESEREARTVAGKLVARSGFKLLTTPRKAGAHD